MTDIEQALAIVRSANPHPTREVEGKLTADEMLLAVQGQPQAVPRPVPRFRRGGLMVAAAAFALVMVLMLPVLMVSRDDTATTESPVTTISAVSTTSVDTELTPLEEAIVGAWIGRWGIWEFDAAGGFRVSSGGVIRDSGNYQVEGDVLTLASVETSRDCPGDMGSYRVESGEEGSLTFLANQNDECPSRSDALDDSTIRPTQAPTSVVDPMLDQTTQALVDQFVAIYNAGNAEAFAAFLHPEFERLITRERIAEPQPQEPVLVLYGVDAVLNMEVTLACTATPSRVVCDVTKYDDLHRVLGIEASPDRRWTLTFEDGLLRAWGEDRENPAVAYEIEAIRPFLDWMRENHPEVPSLFPFVDGDWTVRDGISEDVANFVAEWAASRGVDLDS